MIDKALKKWPNVPACYGWLALDARGQWRLQDERVSHAGLLAFLNQHYRHDEQGRWFVQNGPQRVFVDLAVTPWIYRLQDGLLSAHTGRPAGDLQAIYLDGEGRILIHGTPGIGLLDDRDLAEFLGGCRDEHGETASDDQLEAWYSGTPTALFWSGLALQRLAVNSLPAHFGYLAQPREPESA